MAGRADYIINTIGKKHTICVRRIGKDAHYSEIASTPSEATAVKIVEALNLHQKKKVEIETVVQRVLDDTRALLTQERALSDNLRGGLRKEQRAKEELGRRVNILEGDLRRALLERDEARNGTKEVLASLKG